MLVIISFWVTWMCFFVLSHCPSILGKSALHWAAAVNNVEATLVLLKNGANRDMQDNKVGSCAFIYAISNHRSLVGVLIMNTVYTAEDSDHQSTDSEFFLNNKDSLELVKAEG